MELIETLVDSFHINNNIHLYLMDAIPEEHCTDKATGKGRTVDEQFAHIHHVRLMWLNVCEPKLVNELGKIDKKAITKTDVSTSLIASGKAMEKLLLEGFNKGVIKGAKPYPASFLAYIISHEGHHRGQIILTLKLAGHPVTKKIQLGLWEWGSRG